MPAGTSERELETRTAGRSQESGRLPGVNQDYDPAPCIGLAHLSTLMRAAALIVLILQSHIHEDSAFDSQLLQ